MTLYPNAVPTIDLSRWFDGSDREGVAREVDAALRRVGFLVVTGHGVDPAERAAVRSAARAFFALPPEAKRRYAVSVAGRGWLPPGVEANAYADPYADEAPAAAADLKESYSVGADGVTAPLDGYWFQENVWPQEVPALEAAVSAYLATMKRLADELLRICAAALGVEDDFFTRHTAASTHTLNLNWYPPMALTGPPQEGQFRIGPHTDFGTVTVLDREAGRGGLQVWTPDAGWVDAPFVENAFTINTGDLLARWTGDRWLSNRHRVLPPQADAPDEDLVSLVYFYEADRDTVVEALGPPIGEPHDYAPVVASEFLRERLDAITVP
ncbi:MAG: 2-oxoglutarate and iron-dependent oxygenase domain-containing protein [Lapillicoccus sp.]